MPVLVRCPNPACSASYSVADALLGRTGRCKRCGTKFTLEPEAQAPTEADPVAPAEPTPDFGRYRVVKRLGQGGMGAVYLAHDTQLDRPVALKVPHESSGDHREARERFLREARAAAGFRHPNFCPIYEVGESDGRQYLVLAYIEGRPLADAIERDRPLPQARAAELVRRLARALAEAHRRGVIHRDLKPANVMIDARDELVIMDFGLARRVGSDDPDLTRTGVPMGTPAYMSPEQVEGDKAAIGPGTDIYALGVILYELLTGRRPFEGSISKVLGLIMSQEPPPPSSHRPEISPALEAICRKAMAKTVADRFATMDEMAAALDAYLSQATLSIDLREPPSKPAPKPKLPKPPRPRRPWPKPEPWMVTAAMLMVVAVVVLTWLAPTRDDRADRRAAATIPGLNPPAPPKPTSEVEKPTPQPVASNPPAATEQPAPPPALADPISSPLGITLRLIPAGSFAMGSDDGPDDEKPRHRVEITRPFYLATHEVTQGQYWEVMGRSPSRFGGSDDLPVENIAWHEAIEFCNRLSRREDLGTYYETTTRVTIRGGDGYRLPTEAEWEYACRAGSAARYAFGDDGAELGEYAWFGGNSGDITHPVGRKRPNAFGLYDMHGNVWEWCWDRYAKDAYPRTMVRDPLGPDEGGLRVYRGGSYGDAVSYLSGLRASYRGGVEPSTRSQTRGFRVARSCP